MQSIDYKKLKDHCVKPLEDYFTEYKKFTKGNKTGRYIHIDNNSKVLAVAHLDTVFPESKDFVKYRVLGSDYVFSPNLDDRLGVYTILDYLPKHGINMDILLTENEEKCLSSAYNFKTSKKYNLTE